MCIGVIIMVKTMLLCGRCSDKNHIYHKAKVLYERDSKTGQFIRVGAYAICWRINEGGYDNMRVEMDIGQCPKTIEVDKERLQDFRELHKDKQLLIHKELSKKDLKDNKNSRTIHIKGKGYVTYGHLSNFEKGRYDKNHPDWYLKPQRY